VRYISTRGEAPPLSFVEAMLAGLARDGGLYVPDSCPVLAPERIAGMAGMPYSELALEILRPFVGNSIPEADLARMTSEAYGVFRHPAVAPLVQAGATVLREPDADISWHVLAAPEGNEFCAFTR